MRRERASTPAVRAHLPPSLVLVGRARTPAAKTHTAADRLAQPRSSASPAEVSERRRMTMEASGNRTGKGFQIRTQASAAAAETRRIAARGMTGTAPASTAAAASGPAAVRMPASEAQAWAKTHMEPAEAAARTGSAADSAGAAHTGAAAEPAGAAVRTDSAAGSDRAAVHTDSGPAARTVPIQIRAAGSSDTPLAVDCEQPSVTGFHLRVSSEAEPGSTHFQVHPLVNASAPATTSSYVPLIGIPMR
jgi:hypothetical protein